MVIDKRAARRNILHTFRQATEGDVRGGVEWYPSALSLSRGIAERADLTPSQVAGIIAALSPQMSWEENVRLAEEVIGTGRFRGHTHSNLNKAKRIYRGDDPVGVLTSPFGYGKTLNFYLSILGDKWAICLDRHALSIALGRPATEEERKKLRYNLYRDLSGVYRKVAKGEGMVPSQLQAVTWVTWKRLQKEEVSFDYGI